MRDSSCVRKWAFRLALALVIPGLVAAEQVCRKPNIHDCFDAAFNNDPNAWTRFCSASSYTSQEFAQCMSHNLESSTNKQNYCRYKYLN